MVLPALLEDSSFGDGEAVDQKSECASQCSFTSYQSSMSHNSLYSASGGGPKCFVAESLFQKHPVQDGFVQAAHLEQGATLVGVNGQPLMVRSTKKHMAEELVELKAGSTRSEVGMRSVSCSCWQSSRLGSWRKASQVLDDKRSC
jgi:hypothetical protein